MRASSGFRVTPFPASIALAIALTSFAGAAGEPVPFQAGAGRAATDDDAARHHMPGRPNRGPLPDGGPVFGSAATLFVDDTAPAGGDGASWQTAYRTLRQALLDAENDPTVTEIRVAEGTYRPTDGEGTPDDPQQTDITVVFNMQGQSNLQLLGGFPDGGGDLNDRDPALHRAVLSGDLLGNDVQPVYTEVNSSFTNAYDAGLTFYNISDNSQTVLVASGTDDSVVIDGFTVQGGHDPSHGGGMLAINSALEVRSCTFRWNSATDQGGALFFANGTGIFRLIDCTFENNATLMEGGAVYITNSDYESVTTRFVENCADDGGALFLTGVSGRVVRSVGCSFERNMASNWGGAMHVYGGATFEIESCQFDDNAAIIRGGAVSTYSVAQITQSGFSANRSGVNSNGHGGAVYFNTGSNTIADCVFTGNESGYDGGGAVYTGGSSDTFTDVDFMDNTSVLGHGGALYVGGSSARLTGCSFRRNTALFNHGGAIYFPSSSHYLTDCVFEDNVAGISHHGGAIYSPNYGHQVENCAFRRNSTGYNGGAISFSFSSSCYIRDSVFEENSAGRDGGAVSGIGVISDSEFSGNLAGSDGGGVYWRGTVERCQFQNNAASRGGGFAQYSTTNSFIRHTLFASNSASATGGAVDGFRGTLENCTFSSNFAAQYGGVNSPVSNTIISSVFWMNRDLAGSGTEVQQIGPRFQSVSYTLIEGLSDHGGNSNIDADPEFISPLGPDGFANTGDEDFRLMSTSPAIDAGLAINSGMVTPHEIEQRDAAGFQRFVAFGGGTADRRIDMGAFEAQDCDADGVDDLTAIADGLADDCNEDGLIDGCTNGSFVLGTSERVYPDVGGNSDYFGRGGADIEGDRLVSGAYFEDSNGSNAGAAYVFEHDGDGWDMAHRLVSSAISSSDYFGYGVALSGDRLAIGAYLEDIGASDAGAVFIFEFDGVAWNETQILTDEDDPDSSDYFGFRVLFIGDTLIIASHRDDNERGTDAGAVFVFEPNGDGDYELVQKLIADDGARDEYFGISIDASGDDLIVGAYYDDNQQGNQAGAAYIFTRTDGVYQQRAKLVDNEGSTDDYAGYGVAIDGDVAVVGAYADDPRGSSSGSAVVWNRQGEVWLQGQRLVAGDGASGDDFGISVDISNNTIIVGAQDAFHDANPTSYANTGAAYIFRLVNGVWVDDGKLVPSRLLDDMNYGSRVTIEGDTAVVSANFDDPRSHRSGSVYVYETLTSDFDMDGVPDDCPGASSGCNLADFTDPVGLLDLADVLAFVTAFTGGDLAADLDSSGLLDLADVLLFVNAFTTGCP